MTVMLAAERTAAPAIPAPVAPPQRSGALSLAAMTPQEAWRFSEALAGSALLPREYRDNPGSVLWAMEYGRALGLDVVTTITTIHVINNRPAQSADLMLSRAREAGHRVRIQPGEGNCTVSIWRHDDQEFENRVTWTYADAERAKLLPGKSDSNWAKYPRAMLRARAIAECVRSACPEVLHGAIYTAEELGAQVDESGLPVAAPEGFQRQAPAQDQWEQATPAPAQQTPPEPTPPAEPEQRRDFIAEAIATADLDALAGITLAAADAGAPGWYRAQLDDIAEAHLAADGVAVRKLYDALTVKGAPADHLARIEVIGRAKAATPGTAGSGTTAASATAPATASPASDPLPGSPDDPKARGMAVVDMYAAGRDNSLTPNEVQQAFMDRYKHGVDVATAAELAEFTADLTAAAGTR